MSPKVVCAWCGHVISAGQLPASHGICSTCAAIAEKDI